MNWTAFLSGLVGSAIGTTILGALLKSWLDHRFTIARDAQAKAEKRREECRAVAEILSEWVRSSYMGTNTNEDRWRLQTVYWKNILGMDFTLVKVLFPCLAHAANAKTTNEVLVEARRILLGLETADIPANGLNNWPPVKNHD